jgi:hypothetical protein
LFGTEFAATKSLNAEPEKQTMKTKELLAAITRVAAAIAAACALSINAHAQCNIYMNSSVSDWRIHWW